MKRFARFSHNFNPAQQGGGQAMKKIAVGWDSGSSDYTEAVMKAWHDKVWAWDIDGVSLHSYTTGGWPPHLKSSGFGEDDYATLLKDTLHMDDLLARQTAVMDRYDPKKKLMLAVDEWGAWLSPNPGSNPGFLQQQNSLRDAILAALNLDIFIRHADRVRLANIAQMINVLQAMILTDGPKMVLTPTYHVYRLYVPFQGATAIPVRFDAGTYRHGDVTLPRVDAVAARDASGTLWLALTNVDPDQPAEIAPEIEGVRLRGASGEVLTAPRVDSVNSFDAPETVMPKPISGMMRSGKLVLTLPPKSVTVIRLQQ